VSSGREKRPLEASAFYFDTSIEDDCPNQLMKEVGMPAARSRVDLDWARGFDAAKAYFAAHGHLDVPRYQWFAGVALFSWITRWRGEYRAGRLSPERVSALADLGVEWSPREAEWRRGLRVAQSYYAKNGDLDVTQNHRTEGFNLGSWIAHRRSEYRAGRLAADRVQALERLGMRWTPRNLAWERGLAAASSFFAREGHLRPRAGHRENDIELRSWLARRRRQRNAGQLDPSQVAALDEVGMIWDARAPRSRAKSNSNVESWNRTLVAIRAFRAKHGHLKIPHHYRVGGLNLYQWLYRQRSMYRAGTLLPERVQALQLLGVDWAIRPTEVVGSEV